MTEYTLRNDDDNYNAFRMEAETNDEAIIEMKKHLSESSRRSTEWTLSTVERDEHPELHDRLDFNGAFHQIFVHQCSIDVDGNISDEEKS